MKILIAVPTFETIYPDTFKSIYDLDDGGNEVCFEYVRGYDCARARNMIAMKALEQNADYVFMVDNDVVLPKNALINLLDNAKSVNLGSYAHRGTDNVYHGDSCICKLFDPRGRKYYHYPAESEYKAEELIKMEEEGKYKVQIHGGGMGCALIKTSVFRTLKYPWYDWVNYKDQGVLSEDLYFCEQCKSRDIKIYTDTRVRCGHMLRHVQFLT